ncbi:hypothetical protein V2J09_012521 [Rumex salicifolius]
MNPCTAWPEPVVRVQSLSDSGLQTIPEQYIKPELDRPDCPFSSSSVNEEVNIPLIDLRANEPEAETLEKIRVACTEWGFFQVINHGMNPVLMDRAKEVWWEFFQLPMEMKQRYSNSPKTYEGYGSRLGVQKGAILDWSDYFFLNFLPSSIRDHDKWPTLPSYHSGRMMKFLSKNLGLDENTLQNTLGGENIEASLRVNYYPKCPQPDLTLGLSSHSDPGGLTVLLPDLNVVGLQVRKDGKWVTVKPAPHAFIINIGDQVQMVSNAIYKSVEHRVIVNPNTERLSLAFFYNPRGDIPLEPAHELVTPESPALYEPTTFNEYRLFIRMRGPQGKAQVESLKSPR